MSSCQLTQLPLPSSSAVTQLPLQHQEHRPPPHSCRDVEAHSSLSSLTSLPLSSLPSFSSLSLTSEPLGSELSPEAMLAEIAQLSRQNDLIKAQLSQAQGLRSVLGRMPNNSNGQRRLSSSDTGRVTPQPAGARKVSVSNSTGSQRVQAAEGEQLTNQVRFCLFELSSLMRNRPPGCSSKFEGWLSEFTQNSFFFMLMFRKLHRTSSLWAVWSSASWSSTGKVQQRGVDCWSSLSYRSKMFPPTFLPLVPPSLPLPSVHNLQVGCLNLE